MKCKEKIERKNEGMTNKYVVRKGGWRICKPRKNLQHMSIVFFYVIARSLVERHHRLLGTCCLHCQGESVILKEVVGLPDYSASITDSFDFIVTVMKISNINYVMR
jgi:hypothetical protein